MTPDKGRRKRKLNGSANKVGGGVKGRAIKEQGEVPTAIELEGGGD